MVGKGFLRFGAGFKEGDGGAEIPQMGQSVVAVGIPQDDKPVLRDDNIYLEEEWKMGDGVEVEGGDAGGITICAMAGENPPKLTPKQLGEIAEAEFIAKAVGMGFVVAKPWGDSEPYDFIVNPKKSFIFWRVQVKSAHTIGADGGCSFRAHDHNQKSYTARDIDALVAYARPMNAWYVMPVRVVEELKSLMLYPESRKLRSRFERWREAWEVLRKAVRRRRR
jgi:hypothetical protein